VNDYAILAPAVLLVTLTTFFIWGPSLVGFVVSLIIRSPVQKITRWTVTRAVVSSAHRDGTWIGLDLTGLLDAPMIFYILSIAFAITHSATRFDFGMSWCYVMLRIFYTLNAHFNGRSFTGLILFFGSGATLQVLAVNCLLKILAN
jgi:hypothetical protein